MVKEEAEAVGYEVVMVEEGVVVVKEEVGELEEEVVKIEKGVEAEDYGGG